LTPKAVSLVDKKKRAKETHGWDAQTFAEKREGRYRSLTRSEKTLGKAGNLPCKENKGPAESDTAKGPRNRSSVFLLGRVLQEWNTVGQSQADGENVLGQVGRAGKEVSV